MMRRAFAVPICLFQQNNERIEDIPHEAETTFEHLCIIFISCFLFSCVVFLLNICRIGCVDSYRMRVIAASSKCGNIQSIVRVHTRRNYGFSYAAAAEYSKDATHFCSNQFQTSAVCVEY